MEEKRIRFLYVDLNEGAPGERPLKKKHFFGKCRLQLHYFFILKTRPKMKDSLRIFPQQKGFS